MLVARLQARSDLCSKIKSIQEASERHPRGIQEAKSIQEASRRHLGGTRAISWKHPRGIFQASTHSEKYPRGIWEASLRHPHDSQWQPSSRPAMTSSRDEGIRTSEEYIISSQASTMTTGAKHRREDFADPSSPACKTRLNGALRHQLVSASGDGFRSNYCAMRSWSLREAMANGKRKPLGKRGPRIATFCPICRARLRKKPSAGSKKSCCDKWRSQRTLKPPKSRNANH